MNIGKAIRVKLIRNRGMKNRRRVRIAAARKGVSGFVLWVISSLMSISLVFAGINVAVILKDLPVIGRLEGLIGPEGQLYQPVLFYDRTGQTPIQVNSTELGAVEYIDLTRTMGNTNPALLTIYVENLAASGELIDSPGGFIPPNDELALSIPELLVSNYLIPNEPNSFTHRIRIQLLASQIKAYYGEDQLTSWYLNSVVFRRNVRGAGAASNYFFNKPLDQMDPGETLVLAVICLEPLVNPIDAPEAFDASLQKAISQLINLGIIDETIAHQTIRAQETIKVQPESPDKRDTAFITAAMEQLSTDARFGQHDSGVLKIITSMDVNLQSQLACNLFEILGVPSDQPKCAGVVSNQVMPLPELSSPDDLIVSFLLMDPTNGQVLAMLGDYTVAGGEQSYMSPHSAASLTTPFIYLTGLLQGMSPATLVWDTPTSLDGSILKYYPDDSAFRGPMSVRTALSEDHLAPAAKLLAGYGKERVIELMSGFGLNLYTSEEIPYTSGITDGLSIAQAYGAFANSGIRAGTASQNQTGGPMPTLILKAPDVRGSENIMKDEYQAQTLIGPEMAFLINDMLAFKGQGSLVLRGSTKTSLSPDRANYWRVAYTPKYVFLVFLGYPDPAGKRVLSELEIDKALVRIVEEHFYKDSSFDGWTIPEGISRQEVCVPSGLLPGEVCPNTVMEYFLVGTEPSEIDNLYQEYPIDIETGRLATVFTDPANVSQQVFFTPPLEELAWARAAGYPQAPVDYAMFQSGGATGSTAIVEPLNFSKAKGVITIGGKIEPVGFLSYRLDLGVGLAPSQWLQVGTSTTILPQSNKLGSLDTTRHADGLYTIRIQVLRQGNLIDNSYVVILIDNYSEND